MLSSSASRAIASGRLSRVDGSKSIIRRVVGSRTSSSSRISSRRLAAPLASAANHCKTPFLLYSTERILEQKTGNKNAAKLKTLYDASQETENCGVGLVASLKSVPSRKVVDDADEMLVRMSHRGGCGCDPASGDGAGEFMKDVKNDVVSLEQMNSFLVYY